MIANCSAQKASELLTQKPDCQLIDVREYPEYAAVHAVGARLIPLGQVQRRAAELDKSKPVVILCKSGRRAAQAAQVLSDCGFSELTVVEGGTDAWVTAGLPSAREAKAPWALERQVRLVAGLIVLIGLFIPPWPYVSAFVGAGLVFAALTNTCGMGMLLAKMPWNRQACTKKSCCKA
jgi:rhodanese-related sulfurtransferase